MAFEANLSAELSASIGGAGPSGGAAPSGADLPENRLAPLHVFRFQISFKRAGDAPGGPVQM